MPDAAKGNDSDLIESAKQEDFDRPYHVHADIKKVSNSTFFVFNVDIA
jgi:hypothetical protein